MGDLLMPKLSESMEEGTILKWLVAEGGVLKKGEPLVEIETDKANTTYDSPEDGVLAAVVAKEGQSVPVGQAIARVEAVDEPGESGARTGAKGETQIQELTRPQQNVARRVAESKATVPDYTLAVDVDMTLAVELRARLDDAPDQPPTTSDMVVKAAANALREHPRVNGAYRDGKFEHYSRVNVGLVMPAMDAFVIPTIFDADRKSLGQIAREVQELGEKVRGSSLAAPDLAGGTFTVSDLGSYGIDEFTAIINPPQAAILTIGALKKRPVVDDNGRVVAREGLRLALTCDQRILHGTDAAQFLARLRDLLEHPLHLAL